MGRRCWQWHGPLSTFPGNVLNLHAPNQHSVNKVGPLHSMRIATILPSLDAAGMEVLATGISAALRERGHSVHIICTDALGPLTNQVLEGGGTVQLVPPDRWWRVLWPSNLRDIIRAVSPDVVHIHNSPWLMACRGALLAQVPAVVHTFHGLPAHLPARDKHLMRLGARMTDAVAAVSLALGEYAIRELGMPKERVRVLRNGIDVTRFVRDRAGVLRGHLGLKADALLVALVARFDPVKDHATMLRAFALVATRVPSAHLVLVGDGELRGAIEGNVKALGLVGRVHLLGIRGDMPDLLAETDVVTLSSRAEGLPMALLEAMAAGKSIVATEVGGIPELLSGGAGFVVPPGDPDRLAGVLAGLLQDASLRARTGTLARERVVAHYSMDSMVSAYEDVYRWAMKNPRQRTRRAS